MLDCNLYVRAAHLSAEHRHCHSQYVIAISVKTFGVLHAAASMADRPVPSTATCSSVRTANNTGVSAAQLA